MAGAPKEFTTANNQTHQNYLAEASFGGLLEDGSLYISKET